MSKLPTKAAKPGEIHKLRNPKTGRITCFRRTKKTGFGAWKIVKCAEKSINPAVPQGENFHPSVGWY